MEAVASELESLREEMDRQLKEKTPDAIVLTFTSALMKAAKVVFGVMQGRRTAAQKEEAKQLAALLRQRRALRQRLQGCSEGMDLALTMEIVRLSRQLRRIARVQSSNGGDFWRRSWRRRGGRVCGTMSEGSPGFSVAKE